MRRLCRRKLCVASWRLKTDNYRNVLKDVFVKGSLYYFGYKQGTPISGNTHHSIQGMMRKIRAGTYLARVVCGDPPETEP